MPVYADWSLVRYEDGTLTITLVPQVNIAGWNMRFLVQHRFGGTSGLIEKNVASGYSASSGITVNNSGNGVLSVAIRGADTSGMEFGNYAYTLERMDSGFRTVLSEGYLQLGVGGKT